MKRPIAFYFIAIWCCLGLFIQASHLTRPLQNYQAAGEPIPTQWTILPLVAIAFVVWQTIGLVQLKRCNRWLAVAFFIWWALVLIWNSTTALRQPTVKLLPATLFFSVLVSFNLVSAWYLSRRSFREFAVKFVAERDTEKHSRMSSK